MSKKQFTNMKSVDALTQLAVLLAFDGEDSSSRDVAVGGVHARQRRAVHAQSDLDRTAAELSNATMDPYWIYKNLVREGAHLLREIVDEFDLDEQEVREFAWQRFRSLRLAEERYHAGLEE